ncbi:MAG: FAD-dependent oxidoreductase [Eubacteriales bacterium]
MSKKILIVGGVAGGASTAARLRRLDESAEIILFERGEYISYANCGLPYYVGDVIKSRDSLLLQTPEKLSKKINTDIRIKQEVISIDREKKTVSVKKVDTDETYEESYDKLVLATGSSPIRPPIPGIDSDRIKTLWTIPDTDNIKQFIDEKQVKKAVVVGGGFIGLEMVENLHANGCEVTLVEMLPQVMPTLDFEMAQLLHENLRQNGVNLHLGDGVSSFKEEESFINITLSSGKEVSAELVILAIGVRPNSKLAADCGLTLNARGGIVVDEYLKTSDPDIYAVGDVIEVEDFIDKSRTMIPLAGPANKQGRICADNICGLNQKYEGTQGTSVAKVFDLTAASTGASEKLLIKRGLTYGKDYERAIVLQHSHAGYYPGATMLTMKILFSPDGSKIFGAQIVGREGVDKRIDTVATAIRLNASVIDLKELEFAYAPPYSSAKDPVNMLGFVAENIITKKVAFVKWDELKEKDENRILLDIREDMERLAYEIPGAKAIPLNQLRNRLDEVDKSKEIVVFCSMGARSYNGARVLMQNGYENVKVYPGGTMFFRSVFHDETDQIKEGGVEDMKENEQVRSGDIVTAVQVNCSGLQCPGPIMKVFETIKGIEDGQIIEVSATDPGFARDIDAWCRRTGNTLLKSEKRGNEYFVYIQKGIAKNDLAVPANVSGGNDNKTIIVFSGDLDKVIASFIIANGAAAMGRHVTMFFTFWGLNVLRKPKKQHVKKSFVESMFGGMMPRGLGKLKLSKMNMAGMGTAMMKKVMRDKNIDSLETLVKKAMDNGVKIIACTMSMDVMGIREEELINGVELGGVAAYLGDAEESNVNLFI